MFVPLYNFTECQRLPLNIRRKTFLVHQDDTTHRNDIFFCQERKKIYHKILLLALDVWQQDSARAEENMGVNVGDGTKKNCALRLQGHSFCVCYKCMQFPLKMCPPM